MRLLERIFRERLEWANGRIRRTSGNWFWADALPLRQGRPLGYTVKGKDADGREMICLGVRGVFCWWTEQQGKHPQSPTGGMYFVPYAVCRKCEHYRTADRAIRYSHCEWARQQRGGAGGAVKEVAGIVGEAKRMVGELMGEVQE